MELSFCSQKIFIFCLQGVIALLKCLFFAWELYFLPTVFSQSSKPHWAILPFADKTLGALTPQGIVYLKKKATISTTFFPYFKKTALPFIDQLSTSGGSLSPSNALSASLCREQIFFSLVAEIVTCGHHKSRRISR